MARAAANLKLDPPYDDRLHGVLAFASFSGAENTLRTLEKLRQEYAAAGDKKGVECCRRVALQGRRRAELISRNRKVRPEKRRQKLEIASWFKTWLETPDLFESWLELRKNTCEFRTLLAIESLSISGVRTD